MALQDTTLNPPSHTEVLVDRNRYINPRWFSWMKRMFDSLRSTNANVRTLQDTSVEQGVSITEILELTDGLGARWGVSINGNGQVIGLVRLDGDATGSTFSVVADKFVVAHPAAPGTTITAFVVGLVNGVSTVGINGNLVVDNTILARHIDVSSLSALTADLGTVTAGLIRDSADTVRFDLPNMRLYRVDGKFQLDMKNQIFEFIA